MGKLQEVPQQTPQEESIQGNTEMNLGVVNNQVLETATAGEVKQAEEHKRRQFGANQTKATNLPTPIHPKFRLDVAQQHSGVVVRSFDDSVPPEPAPNSTTH